MHSSTYRNHSSHMIPHLNAEPRWRQVRLGLRLVLLGYVVLAAAALAGPALLWLAFHADPALLGPTGAANAKNVLTVAGIIVLGVGVLVGSLPILAGQWLCMANAPSRNGARGLMLVALLCAFLGLGLTVMAPFVGGKWTYTALQDGLEALDRLDVLQGGLLVHLLGLALGLGSCLALCLFLRAIAGYFVYPEGARHVDVHLFVVSLLIGLSVGVPLMLRPLSSRPEAVLGLAAAWLVCFVWHLFLVGGARACISHGLETFRLKDAVPRTGPLGRLTLSGALRLKW